MMDSTSFRLNATSTAEPAGRKRTLLVIGNCAEASAVECKRAVLPPDPATAAPTPPSAGANQLAATSPTALATPLAAAATAAAAAAAAAAVLSLAASSPPPAAAAGPAGVPPFKLAVADRRRARRRAQACTCTDGSQPSTA